MVSPPLGDLDQHLAERVGRGLHGQHPTCSHWLVPPLSLSRLGAHNADPFRNLLRRASGEHSLSVRRRTMIAFASYRATLVECFRPGQDVETGGQVTTACQ